MSDSTSLQVTVKEFGKAAGAVELERVGREQLVEGELRVKVVASPVNPADLNYIEGTYGVKPELPVRPGLEGVATVLESRDAGFSSGDEVIFVEQCGAWGEELVVPARAVVRIPRGIDPLQSAMLKVNPQTANRLLLDYVDLKEGDWVVQNAANSGVCRCVIQLAKLRGFRTLNLVRREELIPELKALGADEVILDTRESVDAWKEANRDIKPRLAGNSVGGDSALRVMSLLGKGACMATYGAMSLQPIKVPNGFLIFKGLRLEGLWVTEWIKTASKEELEKSYAELGELMKSGKLVQAVDSVYPLNSIKEAIQRATEGKRDGKVLLRISQ